MSLEKKLLIYAENDLNVLLIGSHGIGKSTIVKAIAERLGLRFKYYSSSTLDPFADLVGIPVPDKDKNTINFCRPIDLEEAEFVFFDELNRAHPRVLNTVLEIIQFKSINGTPLKNLKMVWAAINPPGEDYQVEELDPALIDRFHMHISMEPTIHIPYLKNKMATEIAVALRDWWHDDLTDEMRKVVTPRRIEYLGILIDKNIPYRDAIPHGHLLPVPNLEKKIRIARNEEKDIIITEENILQNIDQFLKDMQKDKSLAIEISKVMSKFNEEKIFKCRNLLEEMPKELVLKVGIDKFSMRKRNLYNMFRDAEIDVKQYPKIYEAYGFSLQESDENEEL
jgi:hypothetical protein